MQVKWGAETPITTVDWLWKPFIPFGKVSIIQGDGGEGKTTLILKIAAMLTQGYLPPTMHDGHLDEPVKVEPMTVFYASNEDEISDSTLPRFIRNGGDVSRFAYSAEASEHMHLTEEDMRAVVEQTGAKMIIIDPVQAFLPKNASLSNVTAMRPIFTALSNIALETGAAIVLVGHRNKNEGAKDIHRGLGSADIAAAVRSILLVEMDKNDRKLRTVKTIKSNFDESDNSLLGIRLDAERKVYFEDLYQDELVEENEEVVSPIELAKEFIKDKLADGPVESAVMWEAISEAGISRRTAERAKQELKVKSTRTGGDYWWSL